MVLLSASLISINPDSHRLEVARQLYCSFGSQLQINSLDRLAGAVIQPEDTTMLLTSSSSVASSFMTAPEKNREDFHPAPYYEGRRPVTWVCRFLGRPLTICDRMLVCSYFQSIPILNSKHQGDLVVLAGSASSELAGARGEILNFPAQLVTL